MKVSRYLFHKGIIPSPNFTGKVIKAPYRDDKTPSLFIYTSGNSFHDHSIDEKGGVVELIKLIEHNPNMTTKEALTIFDNVVGNEPKEFDSKYIDFDPKKNKTKFKDEFVKESDEITDLELLAYLRERRIFSIPSCLKQVTLKRGKFINHYVGLKNLSGGYNLRNAKFKKGFGKTDIAVAQIGDSGRIVVVEGLFDGLSWWQYYRDDTIVILNSTSNIKKFIEIAKKKPPHQKFILAFDNGIGGDLAVIACKLELGEDKVIDWRTKYKQYDDLNDSLRRIKKIVKDTEKRVAYKNGIFYYKKTPKSPIIEYENYSLKQFKKEILS
jgi:hypothetical protein